MRKIILPLFLLVAGTAFSQSKLKKADRLFQQADYISAAENFDEYLKSAQEPGVEILKKAGDSHYLMGDMRNALTYYAQVYAIQGNSLAEPHFSRYIESLKGVTDYAQADQVLKSYLTQMGNKAEIARYAYHRRVLDSLKTAEKEHELHTLAINSPNADFGVAFFGEKLVFASSRDTLGLAKGKDKRSAQPFLDLYIADRSMTNGAIFNAHPLKIDNPSNYHESNACFTADLKTIYYTVSHQKKRKLVYDSNFKNQFQIVVGQIDESGKVINTHPVFFNSESYSTGHPTISADGKWLFFASDMPGGYGGTDLYKIEIGDNHTLGTPVNLGPTINTAGNEQFPFFFEDTLYFSSNGHYGLGGLDVYAAQMENGNFTQIPMNLGQPINSHKDDFAYVLHSNGQYGYVSSNREPDKSDDIYFFTKKEIAFEQYVSGIVNEHPSHKTLEGATVKAYNEFDEVVAQTLTASDGSFALTVPKTHGIKVEIEKPNYSKFQQSFDANAENRYHYPKLEVQLSNFTELVSKTHQGVEKIDVNPIYFDYNQATVTAEGEKELQKVIHFMQAFPQVKIKIESHTDSRGKDAYNLQLSDARAKATQVYLLHKGIAAERIISAIGYGESRLINHCGNGVKCSEEQHAVNRRSDFIILEK